MYLSLSNLYLEIISERTSFSYLELYTALKVEWSHRHSERKIKNLSLLLQNHDPCQEDGVIFREQSYLSEQPNDYEMS